MANFIEKRVSFTDGKNSGERVVNSDSLRGIFKKVGYNIFGKELAGCKVSYNSEKKQAILNMGNITITITDVTKIEFKNA